jgi:hypothetical protein
MGTLLVTDGLKQCSTGKSQIQGWEKSFWLQDSTPLDRAALLEADSHPVNGSYANSG